MVSSIMAIPAVYDILKYIHIQGVLMVKKYIGVDIGGTKCAVCLGALQDDEIVIENKLQFPTNVNKGPKYSIDNIISAIQTVVLDEHISGIGISCGGPLDSKNGVILSPPNLPGWDSIGIVDILQDEFKVKTKLMNDANACAVAEWKFGAATGLNNIIFLTFGTGMGSGLILNGALYEGACGMAGEAGHIRMSRTGPVGYGKTGSFEGYCSGGGIARLAKAKAEKLLDKGKTVSFCIDRLSLDDITARSVADAALNKDPAALWVYRKSGEYLGRGLSVLLDILNPEMIVIGSIFTRSRDLLWPHAKRMLEKEALYLTNKSCRIVPAALTESLGDIAAICAVLYQ